MKHLILVALMLSISVAMISCEKKEAPQEESGISFKIKKGSDGIELKLDGLNKPEKEEK